MNDQSPLGTLRTKLDTLTRELQATVAYLHKSETRRLEEAVRWNKIISKETDAVHQLRGNIATHRELINRLEQEVK